MATWGKGIANGYSFCALTGKRDVMQLGGINRPGEEKVFLISTTHGGESHAIAAGLATIEFFQQHNVVKQNLATGSKLIVETRNNIDKAGLTDFVEVSESPWMVVFVFKNNDKQADSGFRTLMMQEMIKRGVLFQGAFVPCYSHNEAEVEFFVQAFQESLQVYLQALKNGYQQYLVGEPAKPVFRKIL